MTHPTSILFVCTGNTCRSPMAEHLMRAIADREGLSLTVASAGVYAYDGQHMSAHAKTVLQRAKMGDTEAFASTRVTEQAIRTAELILTMTASHKRTLMNLFPHASDKIFMLHEYASDEQMDVADPFGGSQDMYQMTANELQDALERIVARWASDMDLFGGPHP
jgi:protein-tyrosine phosphatase